MTAERSWEGSGLGVRGYARPTTEPDPLPDSVAEWAAEDAAAELHRATRHTCWWDERLGMVGAEDCQPCNAKETQP